MAAIGTAMAELGSPFPAGFIAVGEHAFTDGWAEEKQGGMNDRTATRQRR